MGAFTDSDFIHGGTGGRGHEINLSYQVSERTHLALTWFDNTIHRCRSTIHRHRRNQDYERLQLDVGVGF